MCVCVYACVCVCETIYYVHARHVDVYYLLVEVSRQSVTKLLLLRCNQLFHVCQQTIMMFVW